PASSVVAQPALTGPFPFGWASTRAPGTAPPPASVTVPRKVWPTGGPGGCITEGDVDGPPHPGSAPAAMTIIQVPERAEAVTTVVIRLNRKVKRRKLIVFLEPSASRKIGAQHQSCSSKP